MTRKRGLIDDAFIRKCVRFSDHGLSQREIAAALGTSLGTVQRALKKSQRNVTEI